MGDQEYDLSVAVIIVSVILSSLGIFLIFMLYLFTKRVFKHKIQISILTSEQNKELLRSTIQTQENERMRIGANIHDDIGPMLSLLRLQVSQLSKEKDDLLREKMITGNKKTIDDIIEEVRRISKYLVPSVLYELGLEESLNYIIQRLKEVSEAEVKYNNVSNLINIEKSQSLAIYRIIQEGINNILRHADATCIKVSLSQIGSLLQISVEDNGIGCNLENSSIGLGLKNIQARVKALNGHYNFDSIPGEGSQLLISLKIKYEN